MIKVATHLMFQGDAADAIELYASVFSDFSILTIEKYKTDEGGAPGTIKIAKIAFGNQNLIVIDSPVSHKFNFTPSVSIFVDFHSAQELEHAFGRLSDRGEVMMPLNDYGFSQKFGWLSDRFGVSWQLNLP